MADWVQKSMDDELVVECPLCRDTLSFQELRRGVEQVCRHCGGLFALPVEACWEGEGDSGECENSSAADENAAVIEVVPSLKFLAWRYVVEVDGIGHAARYNEPIRVPVASGPHELVVSLALFPRAKKWKFRSQSERRGLIAMAGQVHSFIYKQRISEGDCVLVENGIRGNGVPNQRQSGVVGARVVSQVEVRLSEVSGGQSEAGRSKYCAECGARVAAKAKFCSECGTNLI